EKIQRHDSQQSGDDQCQSANDVGNHRSVPNLMWDIFFNQNHRKNKKTGNQIKRKERKNSNKKIIYQFNERSFYCSNTFCDWIDPDEA
ncbi:MAG: hypothetical protein ACPGRS_11700, partial [bacterium]